MTVVGNQIHDIAIRNGSGKRGDVGRLERKGKKIGLFVFQAYSKVHSVHNAVIRIGDVANRSLKPWGTTQFIW